MKAKNILNRISSKGIGLSLPKGFTLIELLIVVAILGILAAAVLVAINPAQKIAAAKNSTVKSDLSAVASAATLFNTDTGINAGCVASYPNNFGVSTPASPASCTTTITFMSAVNDPNGVAYDFEATASCAMTTAAPCTAVSVMGTAFAEGTTVTGVWCWRSATGAITNMAAANYAAGDLLCNP